VSWPHPVGRWQRHGYRIALQPTTNQEVQIMCFLPGLIGSLAPISLIVTIVFCLYVIIKLNEMAGLLKRLEIQTQTLLMEIQKSRTATPPSVSPKE
jgi:hypothetical protein